MPAGLVLFALWVLATVASCADLLGVDTESEHNPCNDPNADELPPVSCHEGRGICWVLLDACDDLGLPATCPPLEPKPSDTCNDNFDNDCDGAIDEDDCACEKGAEKLCYPASQDTLGQGRGLCREGTQPCQNGVWGQCAGAIIPTSELCDQLDNDCDGEVDEGCACNDGDEQFCYRGPEDTLGHDPCNYGRQHCNEGRWGECKDDVLPSLERCDNLDNDCDGKTDDLPGVGLPCETGLSARCSEGTTQCDAEDSSIRCLPKATSDAELCNGEDDNCDGQVDDGPFCCPDNTLNGNESDIDCGGSCLEKCEVGEMCRDDVDCKTSICAGTRCQPKKGLGEPCDADVKCESTHCVDGVCCDAECSALCYACTTSLRGIGQDGVCGPIASDRDPDEECNSQAPATCGNTGFCNGAGACQQHPATTACREATCSADGITLELVDTCNGSGSCVDRGNQSCAPFTCRGDACTDQLRAGEPCTSASECGDGYCVDGVCCQTACGNGSPGDCQACNVAGHLGTCSASPIGVVCRGATDVCDVAELCDGASTVCPADGVRDAGVVCRSSTGDCDVAEACNGLTKACPAEAFRPSGTVCRDAVGECDLPEVCTGAEPACPGDVFRSSTTACRASAGACDVPEMCSGLSPACPGDTRLPSGTVCREAEGGCDVAETCSGTSAVCPSDQRRPSGTVCREAGPGGCDVEERCNGTSSACPGDAVRPSGAVCRASAGACDLAEACDGSSAVCPGDAVRTSGTVCRAAAGGCDVAEICDGAGAACPGDARAPSGTVCRAVAGGCDLAEICDGSSTVCPADAMRAGGTVCRAVAGDCDVAEACDGATAACPSDVVRPTGTTCRVVAGGCDVAETCDGATAVCPVDVVRATGAVCRVAAGDCDVAEACDGATAACPSDARVPSGTVCRASGGDCDVAEACNGTTAACPSDAMRANGTLCRAAAGDCDVAETCNGSTAACPSDAIRANGAVCRAAAGDCDVAEACDGSTTACPSDARMPSGTVCRASGGDCDVAETCNGTAVACPSDAMRASGAVCRAVAGDCDVAETCNGSMAACPSDAMRANGTLCRGVAGDCDVAETCNGSTAACPSDAMRASGTVCRGVAGDCDAAETCDGATAACPNDAMMPSGTECRAAAGGCDMAESCTGASADCPANTAPCGLYACAGNQCLMSCNADTDCVAGAFCTGNILIPGTCQAHTVLLLGGADEILGAHFHPGEDWQTATITGAQTADRVAVALNLEGGIGLVRGSSGTSRNRPRYARWDYTRWTSFDAWVVGDVNVLGGPALGSEARSIHTAYLVHTTALGDWYEYRGFTGDVWQSGEHVEESEASGLAPDIAVLPSDRPVMVYTHSDSENGSGVLETRVRERTPGNIWAAEFVLSTNVSGGTPSSIVPSSTVPSSIMAFRGGSGADLLVVSVDSAGGIYWRRRTGTTTWSPLMRIGTHTTSHQVALAALDGGLAVVAYRSSSSATAGRLFTSFFNPSGNGSWSAPAQPVNGIRIVGSPALTRGVGAGLSAAASVELAYVLDSTGGGTGTSGAIRHTRCTAMTSGACSSWTSAVGVGAGTGFSSVAIASMP